MRIYSILIYHTLDYSLLHNNFNLNDFYFYTHNKIKSGIIELANATIKNIDKQKFYQITETFNDITFYIYIYTHNNRIYIVLADEEYPKIAILEFIQELIINEQDAFEKIWQKYQDPIQINKILQVKKNLEDTKKIMLDSVDKILERGEKIEDLIDKTDQLNTSSEVFRIKAKQLNSCCNIL